MKIITILFSSILSLFFVSPYPVSAHAGGPPYIKINGAYATTNPLVTYSLSPAPTTQFVVGQDVATPSGYVVGELITFDIDEQFAPFTYTKNTDTVAYQWNFGDNSVPQTGTSVQHIYDHSGTFFVNLSVQFPDKPNDVTSVNTIQLTIKPSIDYPLPQAQIKINGTVIDDPMHDSVEINPNRTVTFDVTDGKGTIMSYQWDFGDETGATEKNVRHKFRSDIYSTYVVLRVTDANNVSTDTFAAIETPIKKPNFFQSLIDTMRDFFANLFP